MSSNRLKPNGAPAPPGFIPIDPLNEGDNSLVGSMVNSVVGTPPARSADQVSRAVAKVPRPKPPKMNYVDPATGAETGDQPEDNPNATAHTTGEAVSDFLWGTPYERKHVASGANAPDLSSLSSPKISQLEQEEMNRGYGPEAALHPYKAQVHRAIAGMLAPVAVANKLAGGAMSPSGAAGSGEGGAAMIPAYAAETIASAPGVISEAIHNPTPDNVQNALLLGAGTAMLAHGAATHAAIDPRAQQIVDEVTAQGGTTHNMRLGNMDGSNHYAVSMFPETTEKIAPGEFNAQRVNLFMQKHADLLNAHPNAAVGAWSAPDGNLYLEVSATTPDKANAVALGKKHNQMSVYDLKNYQDVPTGGTGGLDTPNRDPYLMNGARAYNQLAGLMPPSDSVHVQPDSRGAAMADAYDNAQHEPNNPKVKASYDALKKETKQQYHFLRDVMGIKFEPTEQDPYTGINEMLDDIRNNHRLKIWTGGAPPADHPLSEIDPETGLTYNTLFRGVHDVFGHGATGEDFSEAGEENAWLKHKQMFSKEAQPALTTETRGQANWFFNNKNAREGKPYVFPEQKAGILPDEFQHRGEVDRFKDINPGPQKQPYAGLHYSNAKAQVLEGARRGLVTDQGRSAGKEAPRLRLGSHLGYGQDAPGGVYVYDQGTLGEPFITSRKYSYSVKGNYALADISNNKEWEQAKQAAFADAKAHGASDTQAQMLSLNAAEHAIKDAGYDGYFDGANRKMKNVKFLFGDQNTEQVGAPPKNQVPREAPVPAPVAKPVQHTVTPEGVHIYGTPDEIFAGLQKAFPNHPAFNPEIAGGLRPEDNAQLTHDQLPPESSAAVASRSGSAAGAARETNLFQQVQAEHPEWSVSQQLMEAAKRSEQAGKLHPEAGVVRASVPRTGLNGRKFVEQPDIADDETHHEGDPADVFSLNHDEKAQLTRGKGRWDRFKNYLAHMPSVQEFVDAAKAGSSGRKWYQQSKQAFQHLMEEAPNYFHGDQDMEKFSNVVAATSPNQPVAQNLREALSFWEEWHKQGRPTDPKQIEKIANLTLERDRGAKIPNLIKAITGKGLLGEDKENYYKVGNFAGSLSGPGDHVANDTHQGTFANMTNRNKKALGGPEGYHALASRTREAAKILGWEPREAQAAIWAFWKTLKMMSGTNDVKDVPMFQDIEAVRGARPTEVLPHIDDTAIRQYAQHFGDLMRNDAEVRGKLKQLGVNLDALDAKLKAIPEAAPLEAGEQKATLKRLEPAARRLEKQWGIKAPKRGEASEAGLENADTSFVPDIIRKAAK